MKRLALIAFSLFISSINAQTIPSYIPTDGLVAWYPFNGNANDESGNGNNGEVIDGSIRPFPRLVSDKDGNPVSAYEFDGATSFLSLPELSNQLGQVSTSMSVHIVFKHDMNEITHDGILIHATPQTENNPDVIFSRIGILNKGVKIYHRNPNQNYEPFYDLNLDNDWHSLTYVIDYPTRRGLLYLDGVKLEDAFIYNDESFISNQGRMWELGAVSWEENHHFKGIIDDVAVWNRALTEAEIQNLYTEGNIPPQPIHVSIPDQDVYTIDTTYTSVYVEDVPEAGFNAFQYALSFDPDSIAIEFLDNELSLSADYQITMNEEAAGYVLVAGAGADPITTDGNLTDIKISYKTGGVSTIAIEELMFNEGEPIASSAPSRIDAELLVCGDVTFDNSVSALDAAHILRHTVRLSPQYPLEGRDFIAGDVTRNGSVTAYDAYFVLRDIVGMGSGLSCTSTIYNLKEVWTPKLSWSLYSKGADLVTPIYLSEDSPEVYALEVKVPNGAELTVAGLPGDWNTLEYTNEGTQYLSMYGLTPLSSPELIWERTTGQIIEARVRVNESQWQTIEQEIVGDQVLPQQYVLSQNYPNPFNPNTQISYALPEASQVTLEVFNSLGQRVATLVDAQQSAGYHTASFDASQLSSGVYLYKLSTPGFSQTKKMLLVK